MRKQVNFRLSQQTLRRLSEMASLLRLSKTEVVEQAIGHFYELRVVTGQKSPLMAFAGCISDKEASSMLNVIHDSKMSKDEDVDL